MAQDIRKAWDKTVGAALAQHPITPSEKALIDRMNSVIEANRNAALSMTQSKMRPDIFRDRGG